MPISWRSHPQFHTGYLYLHRPAIVFASRVDQVSFTYPLAQVTFDTVTTGAYTDIRPGMTVLFGSSAGADDLGRQRVRKAATSTILYIGESSIGTRDGEVYLGDNVYITVLDDFRVWAKIPSNKGEGVILKDFDLALGDYGTEPPPVANGGVGYAGFVDSVTSLITVSFSGTGSLATAIGASITDYLWEVDDGTITVGADSDDAITATFPAGFRWVHLTVTDSNGQTHTCHIPVFAADVDDGLTILNFEIEEDTLRRDGHSMRFHILEDIAESDIPDGTLAIYWEDEVVDSTHGSLAGPSGREHVKFIGWHQTDPAQIQARREGLYRDTTLECLDVAGRLANLPGFTQEVVRDASPSDWMEMAGANIDLYLHYLLQWHSTALDLADFQWSGMGSTYPFVSLGSDGQSLWDQVSQRANAIAHELTCDSRGRIWVLPDPLLQDSGDRTSTVIVDIDETDWTALDYTHQRPPTVHWLNGETILASTSDIEAVFCIAPGSAPGQGVNPQTKGTQLVASQTELNAREGHRYARLNASESKFNVALAHGNDAGIEPAYMQWVRMTISAASAAQRGLTFTDARFLVDEVEIQHRSERTGRVKDVRLRLEKETEGFPATTVIRPKGDANLPAFEFPPFTFPEIIWEPLDGEGSFWLNRGTGNMALINRDGYIYRTSDWTTPAAARGPMWDRVSLGAIGTPLDWCVDALSPLYINTGSTVNGWVTTTLGIYRLTDIFGATPGVALQHSFQSTLGTTNASWAVIEFGWGDPDWGVCVIYYKDAAGHTGTWSTYTTDGGTTWSTELQITSHYESAYTGGGYSPGIFCSSRTPGLAYTSALTATGVVPNGAKIYRSTDYGASWSQVTSPGDFDPVDSFVGHIIAPWDDNSDQSIVYAGGMDYQGTDWTGVIGGILMRKNSNGSMSNITPSYTPVATTYRFHPLWRWGLMVSPADRQRVAVCGVDDPQNYFTGQTFVSSDAGDNWTRLDALAGAYLHVFIAGDDSSLLYFWGSSTAGTGAGIWTSPDFGTTIEDKTGNIPTDFAAASTFVGIAGG